MENVEVIELCNNGFVSKERVKNVIHYVCRAALHEAELNRQPDNIVAGLETVRVKLIRFSATHTHNLGIKAVTYSDSLSEYCFNQHNEIPAYILYWLYRFYGGLFGSPMKYASRHYEIYNRLQRAYIEQYHNKKQSDKECKTYLKQARRRICKMYRSGKYSEAFDLYNAPLFDIIPKKDFEDIALLLSNLFPKAFDSCGDDAQTAAVGYVIGRLQGLSEAAQTV